MKKKNDIKKAFSVIIEKRIWSEDLHEKKHIDYNNIEELYYNGKRRKVYIMKHISIASILICFFLFGVTGYAFRDKFIILFKQTNTDIQISSLEADDEKITIEEVYYPEYIVKGYNETMRLEEETINIIEYQNNRGDSITLMQQITSALYNIDSEETEFSIVNIVKEKGYFSEKENQSTLLWVHDSYFFDLTGFPAISKKEMLKIAESIKTKSEKEN